MNLHRTVAWALTAVVFIWAIIVGNTDVPSWTIAIPAVLCGFWWAFGHNITPRQERRLDR